MPLKHLTQITAERRTLLFDPQARVFKRFKAVTIPREILITAKQDRERGINSKLLARTPKTIERAKRLFEKKGFSPLEVRIRQALLLENIAAEFADHAIESTKRVKAMGDEAQSMALDTTILNAKQVESKVWEHYFGLFISKYSRRNGVMAKGVVRTLMKLKRYLTIPELVHHERVLHWKSIKKIENKLMASRIDPASNLGAEAQRTLYRFLGPLSTKSESAYHSAARDLTVAATIYADLICEKSKNEFRNEVEQQEFWNYAYSDGMQKIFPLLGSDEKMMNAIAKLHAREPLKKLTTPEKK